MVWWPWLTIYHSVRETKAAGVKVVDVDGLYLYKKRLLVGTDTSASIPGIPLVSWEPVDGADSSNVEKTPKVTNGKLVEPLWRIIHVICGHQVCCIRTLLAVWGDLAQEGHFGRLCEALLIGHLADWRRWRSTFATHYFAMSGVKWPLQWSKDCIVYTYYWSVKEIWLPFLLLLVNVLLGKYPLPRIIFLKVDP